MLHLLVRRARYFWVLLLRLLVRCLLRFAGATTVAAGYVGLIIGAAFAGLVYVVIALFIERIGVDWVNRIMPPVVIGPTVAIIGLSLAANAVGDFTNK